MQYITVHQAYHCKENASEPISIRYLGEIVPRSEKVTKNTLKVSVEPSLDDRGKISVERGNTEEIQIFPVDDGGGEI